MTCGILVPWPRIEPVPPTLEAPSLYHWTPREVPMAVFFFFLSLMTLFLFFFFNPWQSCGGRDITPVLNAVLLSFCAVLLYPGTYFPFLALSVLLG